MPSGVWAQVKEGPPGVDSGRAFPLFATSMRYRSVALVLLFLLTMGKVQAQEPDPELLIAPVSLSLSPDEAYRAAISFTVQQNAFIVFTDPNARLLKVIVGNERSSREARNHFEVTLLFEPEGSGTIVRVAHHVISSLGNVLTRDTSREAVLEFLTPYLEQYGPDGPGTPGE